MEEFVNLTCRKPEKLPVGGVLHEAGMAELKGKLIGELSGGQLQRVLLAHAMLHRRGSCSWTKRPAASTSKAWPIFIRPSSA